jgi:trans-aconitate 2-methyltransferase
MVLGGVSVDSERQWQQTEVDMPSWNPDLYLQFGNERTQPALDLVRRINLVAPRLIIDLGCGPGNSTALLHQRWPEADITGLDNSAEMLASAARDYPEWKWEQGDASTWTAEVPYDVVYSNAALHWVPNHEQVLPRLFRQVSPGGALAVQMPVHFQSPVHQLILEIARDPAWAHRLDKAVNAIWVGRPGFYYDLLQPQAAQLDLWETEYDHVLDGPKAIVDWIRGTGLRPFLEALADDGQRARFQELLLEGVTRAYPRQKDGRVLFPFRRLFVVAYRQ